jgi:hypothetical protein
MNKRKLGGFALCSMLLTLCLPRPSAAAAENSADRSFLSGVLPYGLPSAAAARIDAFGRRLHDLGYVEGKNIVIEWELTNAN